MVKVKMKSNMQGDNFHYKVGDIVEVENEIALRWNELQIADIIEETEPKKKSVSKNV